MFLASLGLPDDLFGGLRGYYEAAYLADRFIEWSTRHQRGALWTANFVKTSGQGWNPKGEEVCRMSYQEICEQKRRERVEREVLTVTSKW